MRQEKLQQKFRGKTNNCNSQDDEASAEIVEKYKKTLLFSFLKNSSN